MPNFRNTNSSPSAMNGKPKSFKKQLDERQRRNFAREVIRQALTNPNFVVNDHINQDR